MTSGTNLAAPRSQSALAIAIFYAIGTGVGGAAGPWLLGVLIDAGSRTSVFGGYLFGAVLAFLDESAQSS